MHTVVDEFLVGCRREVLIAEDFHLNEALLGQRLEGLSQQLLFNFSVGHHAGLCRHVGLEIFCGPVFLRKRAQLLKLLRVGKHVRVIHQFFAGWNLDALVIFNSPLALQARPRQQIVEIAFDTNRVNADVLPLACRLLNKPRIDDLLVLIQSRRANIAHLECLHQFLHQLLGLIHMLLGRFIDLHSFCL